MLGRREQRVHPERDPADLQRAEEGCGPLRGVGKEDRHPIFRPDAQLPKTVADPIRLRGNLGERALSGGAFERPLAGAIREVALEDLDGVVTEGKVGRPHSAGIRGSGPGGVPSSPERTAAIPASSSTSMRRTKPATKKTTIDPIASR